MIFGSWDLEGLLFEESPKSTWVYIVFQNTNITGLTVDISIMFEALVSVQIIVDFSFCWSTIIVANYDHKATERRLRMRTNVHTTTYCAPCNVIISDPNCTLCAKYGSEQPNSGKFTHGYKTALSIIWPWEARKRTFIELCIAQFASLIHCL